MNWIDATKEQPKMIAGEDFSPNVLAVLDEQLAVMCYCYIPGEDGGYVWANCNGNIEENADFDDDYYYPTHWMPLPELPPT